MNHPAVCSKITVLNSDFTHGHHFTDTSNVGFQQDLVSLTYTRTMYILCETRLQLYTLVHLSLQLAVQSLHHLMITLISDNCLDIKIFGIYFNVFSICWVLALSSSISLVMVTSTLCPLLCLHWSCRWTSRYPLHVYILRSCCRCISITLSDWSKW